MESSKKNFFVAQVLPTFFSLMCFGSAPCVSSWAKWVARMTSLLNDEQMSNDGNKHQPVWKMIFLLKELLAGLLRDDDD